MSTLMQVHVKISKRLKNWKRKHQFICLHHLLLVYTILFNVLWICLLYIVLSSDKLEVGNKCWTNWKSIRLCLSIKFLWNYSLNKTAIYFKSNFCLYIPDGYKKVPFRYLSLKTPHPRSSQTARARCYCQSLRTSRTCLCPTRIVSTSVHVLFRSIVCVSFGFILGRLYIQRQKLFVTD